MTHISPAILGMDLSGKEDKTTFSAVSTHTYVVRPVTRYVVTHSSSESNPSITSYAYGDELCECTSREEAERIALLLAAKAGKVA